LAAYLFSSIALLLSVLSFFYLRAFVIKKTAVERIPEETRDAVRQIIEEINRITDRDAQLVEKRVDDLKKIIAEAERRIGVLTREIEARPRREAVYAELGRKGKIEREINDFAGAAGTFASDSSAVLPETSASVKEHQPSAAVQNHAVKMPEKNTLDNDIFGGGAPNKIEQIILLSASGLTPVQIAARLNTTITEVEMSLVLHRKNG
jgi:uncharacterized membrane protein